MTSACKQIQKLEFDDLLIAQLLDKPWRCFLCSPSLTTAGPFKLAARDQQIPVSTSWHTNLFFFKEKMRDYFPMHSHPLLLMGSVEVLCHLTGMCSSSIPPLLPHPVVCKPVGFPRLLIEQESGQLSSFILHFVFQLKHCTCHCKAVKPDEPDTLIGNGEEYEQYPEL